MTFLGYGGRRERGVVGCYLSCVTSGTDTGHLFMISFRVGGSPL